MQLLTSLSPDSNDAEVQDSFSATNSGASSLPTQTYKSFRLLLEILRTPNETFICRCFRKMLPEASTQLCVLCCDCAGESVWVSLIFDFFYKVGLVSTRLISMGVSFASVRLVAHLDKGTLRLLAENERVASFSPTLRDLLIQAQDKSSAKVRWMKCSRTWLSTPQKWSLNIGKQHKTSHLLESRNISDLDSYQ